ncbi:hypothetical protein [Streptomyces luteogriseus]|uniref:hypothetical protein n=1 Tax=Streptomyces luteogriseus TaxID=68233 RepID=UPI0026159C53|nr:hypothetical protein [uncultured Streptomyces sp.]
MTRTGRKGNHRSKKKRIGLVLAPVVAVAAAVPLMNQAGAATASEVSKDCAEDSSKLEACEFVDVQFKRDNLGPNKRVSPVTDNCGSTSEATKNFSVSASVTRSITLEEGFTASADSKLGNSFFEIGAKFNTTEYKIQRDDKTVGFDFSRTDTVKADHIAFFMWSDKRTDVSGYLKATYKDAQDGQKVFFSPKEGGASVHVFYPQLLDGGTPDGRLWLRNVKCESPQASEAQNSSAGAGEQPGSGDGTQPGFQEGGPDVIDVEIPLSEVVKP